MNDEAGDDFGTVDTTSGLDPDPDDGADADASPLPGFLDEGDDDEPIALSEDELDNIMGDADASDSLDSLDSIDGIDEEDDPFAAGELSDELSDDMLSGMSEDMSADALDPMDPMAADDEFGEGLRPGRRKRRRRKYYSQRRRTQPGAARRRL